MYSRRTDGSNGYSKLVIDGNGQIIEEGVIATIGDQARVFRVRDGEVGVFVDPNSPMDIRIFNPTTMQETGNIDISAAPIFTDIPEALIATAVIRGDDVFALIAGSSADVLLDNFTVVRGSISSGTFQNQLNSTTGQTMTFNFKPNIVDEQGNIFMSHTGNLNPIFPNSGGIVKIPSGFTEI
ncbi:MAG: hypothetical protein AAGI25_09465 [Bacteroidota bacterium]